MVWFDPRCVFAIAEELPLPNGAHDPIQVELRAVMDLAVR